MKLNGNDEQLDDAVEAYERHWSLQSRDQLRVFLRDFELEEDRHAATELIRVDIARRYAENCVVDLRVYCSLFPDIFADEDLVPLIAYEDYRSRSRLGLHVSPSRWANLPGVARQAWFEEASRCGPGPDREPRLRSSGFAQGTGISSHQQARPANDGTATQVLGDEQRLQSMLESAGFSIVRQIGEGAFSSVYLAVQHELSDRYIVLKVVDRPLEEPQQLARLQHTNIVPIYSFHRAGSKSVLCMPYAGVVTLSDFLSGDAPASSRDGQSLTTAVRERVGASAESDQPDGPCEILESDAVDAGPAADDRAAMKPLERLQELAHHELALWIFTKLAAALSHSHARGVLHSDLKPANILIRNDGEPALLDFNLSKSLHCDDASWTGGTLPYMPPEYLNALMGQTIERRATSDIYSLGIILYEFVTGRLPFPAPRSRAPLDLEMAVDQRKSKVSWQKGDMVPFGLRCIIERCLVFDPAGRYQAAEQLQRDLECEMAHRPLLHTSERSIKSRLGKWTRRHPRVSSVSALAAAAMVILAALSAFTWRLSESNRLMAAERLRDQFRTDANRALAGLMVTHADDNTLPAVDQADRCVAMYGVFSDPQWQQHRRLTYLDETSRRVVIHRLTDLLLRSTAARLSIQSDSPEAARIMKQRLALLRQPPFKEAAPTTIARLLEKAGQPVKEDRLPIPSDKHPIDLFAAALYKINRNQGDEALPLLHPQLLNVIDPFSYWIALGRAQMDRGRHDAAEISFSMAIQQMSDCSLGYFYRGTSRLEQRIRDKVGLAEEDFTNAIGLEPNLLEAYVSRALAREVQGNLLGGVADLDRYLHARKNSSRALLIRSRLHRGLANQLHSEADFREALRRKPSTVEDWVSRALARLPHDKHGALDDLAMAAMLDPTSDRILQNQAHVLSEHFGRTDDAIDCLSRLLVLFPFSEKARVGRAVLHARNGNREAAMVDLEQARQRSGRLTSASIYQEACVHALLAGVPSESEPTADSQRLRQLALQRLSQAIQRGYGGPLLTTDPDLKSLHGDPAFEHLVQTVKLGRGH